MEAKYVSSVEGIEAPDGRGSNNHSRRLDLQSAMRRLKQGAGAAHPFMALLSTLSLSVNSWRKALHFGMLTVWGTFNPLPNWLAKEIISGLGRWWVRCLRNPRVLLSLCIVLHTKAGTASVAVIGWVWVRVVSHGLPGGGDQQHACLPGQETAFCSFSSYKWNFPWEDGNMAFPHW